MLYILKQLFASESVNSSGYLLSRSSSIGNIHRYSPPLQQIITIIVTYLLFKNLRVGRNVLTLCSWVSGSSGSSVTLLQNYVCWPLRDQWRSGRCNNKHQPISALVHFLEWWNVNLILHQRVGLLGDKLVMQCFKNCRLVPISQQYAKLTVNTPFSPCGNKYVNISVEKPLRVQTYSRWSKICGRDKMTK